MPRKFVANRAVCIVGDSPNLSSRSIFFLRLSGESPFLGSLSTTSFELIFFSRKPARVRVVAARVFRVRDYRTTHEQS